MTLPDPETTDAEVIVVPTADVLEQIDDENPFKATIAELRENGKSWESIWERLEEAYNPVDTATYEESFIEMPEYELQAVVHNEQATSGERYKRYNCLAEFESKAIELTEDKPAVRRVESVEKVGMERVS